MEKIMGKIITLILLIPTISFSLVDEKNIGKTISKSKETRDQIEAQLKTRNPANASINNWNDFEEVMKSDNDWENEVNSIIKEYE